MGGGSLAEPTEGICDETIGGTEKRRSQTPKDQQRLDNEMR